MWKLTKYVFRTLAIFGFGVFFSNLLFWFYPGAFIGLGVYGAAQRAAQVANAQPAPPFSPADISAVLLTVATIVLATVAFMVSIGAFFGFGEIKRIVADLADQETARTRRELDQLKAENAAQIQKAVANAKAEMALITDKIAADESRRQASGLPADPTIDEIAQAAGTDDPVSI